jgi:hypothetical protein
MKLFSLDTYLHAVDGELQDNYPWMWLRTNPHDFETCGARKDHFALEAWERQTTGGVNGSGDLRVAGRKFYVETGHVETYERGTSR